MACSGALKSVSTVTITAADSRTLRYAWRGIGNRGEQLLIELQERYTLRLCFWCFTLGPDVVSEKVTFRSKVVGGALTVLPSRACFTRVLSSQNQAAL